MLRLIKQDDGNALVMVGLSMVAIMGFSALAIDVGVMLTARNQLQNAADAAALAGASGLIDSQAEATNRAITYAAANTCLNQPVVITGSDVTFPTASQIRVQALRPVNLFFANVLGMNLANIDAVAVAELGTLSGSSKIKPWAIPDSNYVVGEQILLKAGELGAPATNASYFYPVNFPPINKGTPIPGAQAYGENIMNGSSVPIEIGDILQVEPGNMVGPTKQGVDYLISQDPGAYWDDSLGGVTNSAHPGYSSPRIIKIPFYDRNDPPSSGRNTVTVVRLGAFFLEGMQGRNVTGRFMEITTSGIPGGGGSMLFSVKLIQ